MPDKNHLDKFTDAENTELMSEFKTATLRGDPIAVYQAILHCDEHQIALPEWLTAHLLKLIADYHLGRKPSWKGVGNRPLTIIRRRIQDDVRRRAVSGVTAWSKDKNKYQEMPTNCIDAWNDQIYWHSQIDNREDILGFASYGLRDIRLQENGPFLARSTRTLRRITADKTATQQVQLSGRIASVFGLTDPDTLFGTEKVLKPNLK